MQRNSTPCWHTQALIKQGRDTEKCLKVNYPSRKVASLWLLCPVTIHWVSLKWLKVHNPKKQTKDRVHTPVVDRLLHLWIFTYYSKISAEEAPHHGGQIVSPARVFGFSHVGLNGKQCCRLAHLFGGRLCLLYLSLSLSLTHPHTAPDQHSSEKIEKKRAETCR